MRRLRKKTHRVARESVGTGKPLASARGFSAGSIVVRVGFKAAEEAATFAKHFAGRVL
jgi:hypothetical protein